MEKPEGLSRLAYDEAIRCVAEQQAALESVRGRAAINVGIASLAASFLGPSAIESAHESTSAEILSLVAALCFLASIGLAVCVLRSGSGWVFNQSPQKILDDYDGSDIVDVYRTLAGFLQESIDNNETLLKSRFRAMNAAFILTAIMVLCALGIVGIGYWR
jgi:hypothetical protein